MIAVDEALALTHAAVAPVGLRRPPLRDVLGRTLARDVASRLDLPPVDQAVMDGYAVASPDGGALRVCGQSRPGLEAPPDPGRGACIRIFTGAPVPTWVYAVVPREDVELNGEIATVRGPIEAGQWIRRRGDERAQGSLVLPAGLHLDTGAIAAAAAAGWSALHVHRPARVVVLVTGDEVVPPGAPRGPTEIYDANTAMCLAWAQSHRLALVGVARLPDSVDAVAAAIDDALDQADLVITTGGVSVGDHDPVGPAVERLGLERRFWRVAQKPARPLLLATRANRALLGLPGNPASVLVGLRVFGDTLLRAWSARPPEPFRPGRLAAAVAGDRRAQWLRCAVQYRDDGVWLQPLENQASHMLGNLAHADALVLLAAEAAGAPGDLVRWIPLRGAA